MSSATQVSSALSYNPWQRGFHWGMAIIILIAIALGVTAAELPRDALRSQILMVHKSFGVAIFALLALRVVLRLAAGAPPYRVPLDRLTGIGAKAAHLALYLLMLLMPVTGYVTSSADGHPVPFFGLGNLPNVAPRSHELADRASDAHFVFAWAIGIVLSLHVAAALWHAWAKRDEVMDRMWPGFVRRFV